MTKVKSMPTTAINSYLGMVFTNDARNFIAKVTGVNKDHRQRMLVPFKVERYPVRKSKNGKTAIDARYLDYRITARNGRVIKFRFDQVYNKFLFLDKGSPAKYKTLCDVWKCHEEVMMYRGQKGSGFAYGRRNRHKISTVELSKARKVLTPRD